MIHNPYLHDCQICVLANAAHIRLSHGSTLQIELHVHRRDERNEKMKKKVPIQKVSFQVRDANRSDGQLELFGQVNVVRCFIV